MAFNSRRYTIHFGGAMMVYSVVLIASIAALNRLELDVLPAVLIALAPVLPVLYALRAYVVEFRSIDEFQRRIQAEAIIWSAGLVGFGSFAWGFVEIAVDVPRVSFIWILPALIAVYGLTQCVLMWRFK